MDPDLNELLLADDDGQYLEGGEGGAGASARASKHHVEKPKYLADETADASDLARQRWALVVPEGPEGSRLAELARRLVRQRAEDQGAAVDTIRVPRAETATPEGALTWMRTKYPSQYGGHEYRRPRYLLLLGDFDQVSLPMQLAFAVHSFPGRVALDREEQYEVYFDKLLRHQRTPAPQHEARALLYTVHDGTDATRVGHRRLISKLAESCADLRAAKRREFPAELPQTLGAARPDPQELLNLARAPTPTVLFSLSHGKGPPRRDGWTRAQAMELQGSMHFGAAGAITPRELAQATFLPGGLWFYFACFGAGTPERSAYHHWLEGRPGGRGDLGRVLHGLARGGGGFTSGLAKAALANPDGPLGVIGHVDLAWTHCFDEVLGSGKDVKRINRASQFVGPIATLMQQQRVGAALLRLRIALREVTVAINSTYDAAKERGGASGYAIADAEALGNLWMLRQDLNQFVLLGDPAASFFLSPPPKPTVTELLSSTFGFGVASQQAEPEPEPAGERLARQMESGLRELFFRDVSIERLAREFHVSVEELRRWERAYRSAGRDALANIVIKRDGE